MEENSNTGTAGFLIVTYSSLALLAGSWPLLNTITSVAEAKALYSVLEIVKDNLTMIQHSFISNADFHTAITTACSHLHWRTDSWISNIRERLMSLENPQIHYCYHQISYSWSKPSSHLFIPSR